MSDGNGAKETLQVYFRKFGNVHVDHFLIWLWTQGYKVVPVEESEA